MIIVHDKLLEFGGAELVLQSIIKTCNPDFVISPCVDNVASWEKVLGVKVIPLRIFRFVNSQARYRALYPLLCFALMFVRINALGKDVIYYSSSLGKHIVFKNYRSLKLYSNFPFKGAVQPEKYLVGKGFLQRCFSSSLRFVFKNVENLVCKKFEKTFVISKASKAAYNSIGIKVDGVIHCPVSHDMRLFIAAESCKTSIVDNSEIPQIVIVSRLYHEKNLSDILSTLNELSVSVTVVGDGPMLREFKKLYPKIRFTGFVSESEKIQIIRSANFLVNPTAQEWSLTTVEANCLGVVTVARFCEAISEINFAISGDCNYPNRTFTDSNQLKEMVCHTTSMSSHNFSVEAQAAFGYAAFERSFRAFFEVDK